MVQRVKVEMSGARRVRRRVALTHATWLNISWLFSRILALGYWGLVPLSLFLPLLVLVTGVAFILCAWLILRCLQASFRVVLVRL